MNIWFISKYASPPNYAKSPTRLFHLAKEIAQIGHQTLLITSDSNHFSSYPTTSKRYNDELIEGVQVRWIKTKKYVRTASLRRIISWFDFEWKLFLMNTKRINTPDVVIISSLSIFSILYGYYMKRKYGALLVFEIRDIWPLTMTEEGGFNRWHPLVLLIGFVEKFGYRNADLIVGTMPKLNRHVENILGYSRPFLCSPLGFNRVDYEETDLLVKNPFKDAFPKDKIVVGYAGSMGITNALEPLIESIKLLQHDSSIYFALLGSGDLKESYQQQLAGYTNVIFFERIAQNEVKYFLDICDILYLSTKNSKVWEYGQSMNKVVEYMLAAKPILATYSGYPSMINEADCGCFITGDNVNDVKTAIKNMASKPKSELVKIGVNGRDWILAHRSYAKLAQGYLEKIVSLKTS